MSAPWRPWISLVTIALKMASTTSGAARAVSARRINLGRISSEAGPLAPEQPERDRDDHGHDHPDVEGQPAGPALGFVLGQRNVGRFRVRHRGLLLQDR